MTDKTKAQRVAEALADPRIAQWRRNQEGRRYRDAGVSAAMARLLDALALPDDPPGDAGLLRELRSKVASARERNARHRQGCNDRVDDATFAARIAMCDWVDSEIDRLLAAAPADKPAETAPEPVDDFDTALAKARAKARSEPDAGTTVDERERRIADSGGWHSRSETRKSILAALGDDLDTPDDELLDAVAVMVDDATRRAERAEAEVARLTKALDEREADMHARIRAGYDKTVADSWRAEVERMTKERDEARAVIHTHDLCHNQFKVGAREFADGCAKEQRKHFGCAPDADELDRERGGWAALERLRDWIHARLRTTLLESVDIDGPDMWARGAYLFVRSEADRLLASRPAQGKEAGRG